ncbi:teichoic acid ABC transporter permease [Mammaliicoccus sciuri]|uniref:ABC transporter permease n=1 Tax=Mammaliicoccus sciuri TaxID=1296 RepID=UPI000A00518F|nr:ABC transporter permease [Mammaliicoccus sciuri]ORI00121.1 teichoic acid ABC transporter permease [Mammaliicoccus sciuri]
MNSIYFIFKEQATNFYLIKRLADFEVKISNKNNYLGTTWELINPIIQISIYWFIFGLGFKNNASVDGIPFIYWLIVGISMWFFVNQGILDGTRSIASKYNQVAKMNFPLSILPSYIVFSKFYGHIGLLLIILLICYIGGYPPNIYTLQLIIYIPYTLILTTSIALLTSTINVIIRDTQMIIQAIMRLIFFVSSILYIPENHIVLTVIKFNPIYFLAEGYRASILKKEWFFISHWQLSIYNLLLLITIFSLGAILHKRYRDYFSDFI